MRTIFIVLFAALICGRQVYAQAPADVPANIKAAFKKKYDGAAKVKWNKEDKKYEVSFSYKGKEMSVLYNPDCTLAETETRIAVNELPSKAQKYAEAKGKVKEAARIEMANGTVKYEAEVKGVDLLFDNTGNFIDEKVEKNEGRN